MLTRDNLIKQYNNLVALLINKQNEKGFWTGQLSSSALSTAVAVVALKIRNAPLYEQKINHGLIWLLNHQNPDGGFGDTPESNSNISTSLLSYAALKYCSKGSDEEKTALMNLEGFLLSRNISLTPETITSSVLNFYGKDYTFSVPILSMLIICGVMEAKSSRSIPQLPFELVVFPASWYSIFNLRVVSYALPALIAMGIFIFRKRSRHNPLMKIIRNRSINTALGKLTQIVPESGGFLEATPLTAFVNMCLVSSGLGNTIVVDKGISFLLDQQREDGSWPIDTDLSTWVTTLSVKALGVNTRKALKKEKAEKLHKHLLSLQYRTRHPFNNSLPGGWGWTDHSGSVPDVDDTCGAILALLELGIDTEQEAESIIKGCNWLLAQQNSDGGFPTFCRGWGRLPFDSSCSDLTAHAFYALISVIEKLEDKLSGELKTHFYRSAKRGLEFLTKMQKQDGSWLPLWFGNQFTAAKTNPVYGTAKAGIYLSDCLKYSSIEEEIKRKINQLLFKAETYLTSQQNSDGSWGGSYGIKGTFEETSLAVSFLNKRNEEKSLKGLQWLQDTYEKEGLYSSPVGLYFAALWYDEKMYPLIFYIEALRRFLE